MVIGIIIVLLITFIAIKLLAGGVTSLFSKSELQMEINAQITAISNMLQTIGQRFFGLQPTNPVYSQISAEIVGAVTNWAEAVLGGIVGNFEHLMLGLLIVLFLPYYLLVGEDYLLKLGRSVIPFNETNTDLLIKDFKNILYSVIICTGLLAVIQAVPLTLTFMYFNVPGAVLLGFLGMLLACVPFLGVPMIWIPLALLELIGGDYGAAIGITLVGVLVFIIDNMRPILQKNIGEIPPLISIFGVIIGMTFFGVLGLFIGPILLSATLLIAKMFKEEYVDEAKF
jgi:predicted PurR-regulated permease PerM